MQRAQGREQACRLIHEDAAAVYGGTDRVGRNEQHAGSAGVFRKRLEAVAKVAAQRSAKGFGIGNRCKSARAPARAPSLGEPENRLQQSLQVCSFGGLAENSAQNRGGKRERKMGSEAAPFV